MGEPCSTHGPYEKCVQICDQKARRVRDHTEDLLVSGSIMLE